MNSQLYHYIIGCHVSVKKNTTVVERSSAPLLFYAKSSDSHFTPLRGPAVLGTVRYESTPEGLKSVSGPSTWNWYDVSRQTTRNSERTTPLGRRSEGNWVSGGTPY